MQIFPIFSEYHFHRIFKTYQGETLGSYISRIRIERAAILLKYSEIPIEKIAQNVGYENPSAFSRAFKSFFDFTPIEYRNNYNIRNQKSTVNTFPLGLDYPQIVKLQSKTVIYVQLVGMPDTMDFPNAYAKLWYLIKEENISKNQPFEHIAIYHDDPMITASKKYRSSACISINQPIKPQ